MAGWKLLFSSSTKFSIFGLFTQAALKAMKDRNEKLSSLTLKKQLLFIQGIIFS